MHQRFAVHRSFAVFSCLRAIVIGSVLLYAPVLAQEPPVPSDPLELVTGDAQPVQDVNQRAEIINILVNARRRSNVRAQPYDLKTTFTVSGALSSGTWQAEDMSPGAGRYRWTVEGPGFSAVNMNVNRIFYSDQQATDLPLRLIQFREAIFYMAPVVGPRATLRTATGTLNGVNLTCALAARDATAPAGTGGRQWEEEEYCVDPNVRRVDHVLAGARLICRSTIIRKGCSFHGK